MKTIQEKNGEVEYVLTSEEYKRLHEANQVMMEALKDLVNGYGFAPGHSIEKARAAIAKGEAK